MIQNQQPTPQPGYIVPTNPAVPASLQQQKLYFCATNPSHPSCPPYGPAPGPFGYLPAPWPAATPVATSVTTPIATPAASLALAPASVPTSVTHTTDHPDHTGFQLNVNGQLGT